MNILKLLFKSGIWNAPALNKLDTINSTNLSRIQSEISGKLGYNVDADVIKTVALKRLLECYNTDEIIEVLRYYQQLK